MKGLVYFDKIKINKKVKKEKQRIKYTNEKNTFFYRLMFIIIKKEK